MSIDIPHGGGIDTIRTPTHTSSGVENKSLPHGVTQKYWDRAETIIQEASAETAQEQWNFDSRLSRILQDAQLRMNEIVLPVDMAYFWILFTQLHDCIWEDKKLDTVSSIFIWNKMIHILENVLSLFKTTWFRKYIIAFISMNNTLFSLLWEWEVSGISKDAEILRARITFILRELIKEYQKTKNPEIQKEYETIYDFARKYNLTHTINQWWHPWIVFNRNLTCGGLVPSGTL